MIRKMTFFSEVIIDARYVIFNRIDTGRSKVMPLDRRVEVCRQIPFTVFRRAFHFFSHNLAALSLHICL